MVSSCTGSILLCAVVCAVKKVFDCGLSIIYDGLTRKTCSSQFRRYDAVDLILVLQIRIYEILAQYRKSYLTQAVTWAVHKSGTHAHGRHGYVQVTSSCNIVPQGIQELL